MMRIRTIRTAVEEIKAEDPGTAITEYAIRSAIWEGKIKAKKVGVKNLVDIDEVKRYFTE